MALAKTANTRVFIIEGGARYDHAAVYQNCMRMMALSQGFGDIERIECPNPYQYGKFDEIGQIRGATERPTTSLEGQYALDILSTLFRLARKGCSFDVQLHMGECENPSVFNTFSKSVVLETASPTNYATEDLGALQSGDNAAILETIDVSAEETYEVVPLAMSEVAASEVTNEVIDIVVCDALSCGGDCASESDGCQKIFAITKSAGGSPGTAPDVVFSIDGGSTWYAHDIESLGAAEDPDGIECLGDYLVVVSNASNSQHYALKSEHNGYTDPTWTEVTTGYVALGEPNDIWSTGQYAFIVGDGGYIYGCSNATEGVTVLNAGAATVDDLLAVHGLSATMAVAVGEHGAVVRTLDGTTWAAVNRPVGIGINLNTVWVTSETVWGVGASNGRLYYTLDGGTTWTEKAFTGSGTGSVHSLVFSSGSVGYLSHATAAPRGYILRTYDGGNSWIRVPEKTGTMPDNDRINALAFCGTNVNFVVGGGLGSDGADGFIVLGEGT